MGFVRLNISSFFAVLLAGCNGGSQSDLANTLRGASGTEASNSTLKISPSALSFGKVVLGSEYSDQNITITNSASASIYLSDMVFSDLAPNLTTSKYFSVTSGTCTSDSPLPAGGSCTVIIRLKTPINPGSITAAGTIAFGGSLDDHPFSSTVNISATISSATSAQIGNSAISFSPTPYQFPNTSLNQNTSKIITLKNTSAFDATISSYTGVALPFSIDQNTCPAVGKTFISGASCTMTVSFQPTASGVSVNYLTANYSVAGNAGITVSSNVSLTGASGSLGTSAIAFSPATYSFGSLRVNSGSGVKTFTITNSATNSIYINSIAGFDSNYTNVSTNCPLTPSPFAAGAVCNLTVQFAPHSTGALSGNILISYDEVPGNSAFQTSLALTGTGVGVLSFAGLASIGPDTAITTSQMQLNWLAATGGTVSRYYIYQVTGGSLVYVADVASTQTSYSVTGLTANTPYTFLVRASDTLGVPDSNNSQITQNTDAVGSFPAFTIGAVAEGSTTISGNLSCTTGVVKSVAPVASFSIVSQSDAAVNCSIVGGGPYQVSCSPSYKTGHASWPSNVTARCSLDGAAIDLVTAITVNDTVRAPVLAATSNFSAIAGSAITAVDPKISAALTDADGDTMSFTCKYDTVVDGAVAGGAASCAALPATAFSFSATTGILNWTPSNAAAVGGSQPYEISITASNGLGQTTSDIFVITINGTIVNSVSSTAANGTYAIGATLPITVNFSGPVTVTGSPTLTFATTGTNGVANYSSGSGASTLTFNYTVLSGQSSAALNYLNTSALALNGGTILDVLSSPAVLTLPATGSASALALTKSLVIDGVRANVINVTSTKPDGTYGAGAAMSIQVTFDKNITVAGGTPTLLLATGTTSETASYTSTTTSNTLNFSYTVQVGDTTSSGNLNYVATNSLALGGATISDAAGNTALLTLPALVSTARLAANKNIIIDAVLPAVTNIYSNKANGFYTTGTLIDVRATFTKAVNVTGAPRILLATGSTQRYANYSSGSGSSSLVFNYTVQSGDSANLLDYVATTSFGLNGGTIKDAMLNVATLTLATPGAANSLSANASFVIDTVPATVLGVSSTLANGSYKTGQSIPIQITFSKNVTVAGGTPTLLLSTGTVNQTANFTSVTGAVATFTYVVQSGDSATLLDYVSTTSLATNSATISDMMGNSATLTLPTPTAAGSLSANKTFAIMTATPATPVISTPATGTYKTVNTFSLTGTGPAGLTISIKDASTTLGTTTGASWTYAIGTALSEGSHTFTAIASDAAGNVSAASNSVVVTVSTVPPSAPVIGTVTTPTNNATPTISGTSGASVTVNLYQAATLIGTTTASAGGTWSIVSSSLSDGVYSLTAKAVNPAGQVSTASTAVSLTINTVTPTVSGVTSSTANGTYSAGITVSVIVGFSTNMVVTGTPQIQMACGGSSPWASYTSGSGTSSLTFQFTTAPGQSTAHLDYLATSSLTTNGGTIKDTAGNNATLTLATPAAANSLYANSNIAIDALLPVVSGVSSAVTNGTYGPGTVIPIVVTFLKVVTVAVSTPTLTLGTTPNQIVNYTSGSGSTALTFAYTVQSGDVSSRLDVTSTTALSLAGSTIKDALGNNAVLTLAAPGGAGSLGNAKFLVIAGTASAQGLTASTTTQTLIATTAITPVDVNVTSTGNDNDSHGAAMSYSCTYNSGTACSSLPNTVYSFSTSTGILNWTPSASAAPSSSTTYTFTVTGTDSYHMTSSVNYSVTVQPKVVLTTFANKVFPSTYLDQGATLNLDWNNTATGTDVGVTYACVFDQIPDGAVAAGTACSSLPGIATFNTTTGILAWTPDASAWGPYELKVTGTGSASSDIKYLIVDVRQPYVKTNLIGDWDTQFANLSAPNTGAATTWNDLTTFANNGSLTATTISWPGTGVFSNPFALSFLGAEYVDFGSSTLSGITKMMFDTWIKPTSASSGDTVILGNSNDSAGNGFTLRQSKSQPGKLELTIGKTYQDIVLSDSPVVYARLGESTGSVAKNLGTNGIDGTYLGGYTLAQTGAITGSLDTSTTFNGSTGYVNFGNSASVQLSNGTMEAWFKTTDGAGSYKAIFAKQNAFGLFISSSSLLFEDWIGGDRTTSTAVNNNVWHHVVATFQSGVPSGTLVYIDGVLKLTTQMTISNQTISLMVGSGNSGAQYIAGTIQEVALYNTILTPTQILAHYNAGIGSVGGSCRTTSTFSNNVWNSIAGIFDGNSLSLFVNGQQECSVASVPATFSTPATNLVAGATVTGTKAWSGSTAALRVYGTSNGAVVGTASTVNTNFAATADRFRSSAQGNIVTAGLVLNLDAANASRGLTFPNLGCAVTSWFDLSLSALNGTLTNFSGCGATTGWNGDGATSGAGTSGPYRLTFNGTNNYVKIPYVFPLSNYTYEVWFQSLSVSQTISFVSAGTLGSTGNDRALSIDSSGHVCHYLYSPAQQTICSTSAYNDGNWHNAVVTLQSGVAQKIYVDDTLVASGGNNTSAFNWSTDFIIGGQQPTVGNYFSGSIAKAAVYGSVLTPAQIAQNCKALQTRFSGAICN